MKRLLLSAIFTCLSFFSFAQATFNGTIDNDWNKPANWSTTLVPDFDTDVIIPGNLSVAINSNVAVKSITVIGSISGSIDNIILDSNLNISNASNLGQFRWLSGTISGGATITTGTKTILAGTGSKYLTSGTNLTLNVTNCLGTGTLYLSDCILNVLELGLTTNFSIEGSGTSILTTTNWITKSGANTTASINCRLVSNGVISVSAGVLNINSIDAHFNPHPVSLQTFYTDSAAMLNLSGNLTFAGTFPVNSSSPININGTINIPNNATFNQYGGAAGFNWTGGTLTGGGTLTNNVNMLFSGTEAKYIYSNTTFVNTGTLTMEGDGNLTITPGALTNTGTINVQGNGYIYLTNSLLDNLASGTINLMSNSGISYSQSATDLFNNAGTINRTTGTGTAKIAGRFQNSGTINVTSGTLETSGICEFNGGYYSVANGAVMNCTEEKSFSGSLSGALDGPMNLIGNFQIPGAAGFNMTGTAGVHWISGFMTGGGTLSNLGVINCSSNDFITYISGNTTLSNSGTLNISGTGGLYLTDSALNNLSSGVINLSANTTLGLTMSATDMLNNQGTINRTTTTGIAHLSCRFTNSGTINVTSGTLNLDNVGDYHFNGGVYNVSAGSVLNCQIPGTLSGTLTGTLDGPMNIWNNFDITSSVTNATGGLEGLHWKNGFVGGGGTFNNASVLHLSDTFDRYLTNNTTLVNSGILDLTAGNLYVSGSTVNNTASGIIDLKSDSVTLGASSSAFFVLNNSGLLKKSSGSGTSTVNLTLNNNGIIDVQSGTLNLAGSVGILNNNATGTVMGIGTVNLPVAANLENNGTFSPGGHPGTLTAVGNYESNTDAKLAVELNGLTPNSQYDRLAISGNAIMDGTVDVTLGFAPLINDEFVVATTTGTVTTFSISPTTTAVYNGTEYTFDVTLRNNNEVVLKVASLGINETLMDEITVAPNPAQEMLWLKNTSGLQLSRAEICDLNGRIIENVALENASIEQIIPIQQLQSGIYLIKIISENSSVVKRIIKQ